MKVAVFSDIQANLPALEEVVDRIEAWRPELVVMAGDLVNRGPDSLGCLRLFDRYRREQGWLPVQGNHEVWVLRCGREAPRSEGDRAVRQFTDWAWGQVAGDVDKLRGWADHLCFHPPGSADWVHVTHGSMVGNRDGITASTPDEALPAKVPEGVALMVVGHTHRAMQRHALGMDIVNVGSAGSPFDGDVRGSWAKLEYVAGRWKTQIERFSYDRARAARDFETSGFLDQGGPLARLVFMEWQRAQLLISGWRQRYEPAVIAGEIPLGRSIELYLAGID
jgi:predicted phosphodiesterase